MADEQARRKPWGEPLHKLDGAWTRLEQRLAVGIVMAEIAAIGVWVLLKGMQADGSFAHGAVVRQGITSIAFATVAHLLLRKRVPAVVHGGVVTVLAVVGWVVVGTMWPMGGVAYSKNLLGWLQNASFLTLLGGLRGLVTRLTLWLALVGAALAASAGKHISVDVAGRYMPKGVLTKVACAGWLFAAAVCFVGSYAFVDNIAVTKFNAKPFEPCGKASCDTPFSTRLTTVRQGVDEDFFAARRQLGLDVRTVGKVVAGKSYEQSFTNAEWNQWIEQGGWRDRFGGKASSLTAPATPGTHSPAISVPGRNTRGLLIRDFDFLFPFGLLMIGLRFLLRVILVIAGYIKVDPDAAHGEEGVGQASVDTPAEAT